MIKGKKRISSTNLWKRVYDLMKLCVKKLLRMCVLKLVYKFQDIAHSYYINLTLQSLLKNFLPVLESFFWNPKRITLDENSLSRVFRQFRI